MRVLQRVRALSRLNRRLVIALAAGGVVVISLGIAGSSRWGQPPSDAGLRIATTGMYLAHIGTTYEVVLNAVGGVGPYTWSTGADQLPAGIEVEPASGRIFGTPTQGGEFTVDVSVADSNGLTASKTFVVRVFDQPLDLYGGLNNLPCPSGPAPHFYTQKIGSRWVLCTPAGNAFWMNGVYNVQPGDSDKDEQGVALLSVLRTKYAKGLTPDATLNWALQAVRRMKAWGFNTLNEYSHAATWATNTDFGWNEITSDRTIPEKLPFTIIVRPAWYSLRNSEGYANQPVKDLMNGIRPDVYTGYRAVAADFWDSNYSLWFQTALTKDFLIHQACTGVNNDFLIGITVDESDNMYGFGPGPDFPTVANNVVDQGYDQPNLGWMVLVTAPTQSSNTNLGIKYTDTTVYSKQELSNWLAARYEGSIVALNSNWGAQYTAFGSAGGFGSGSGLLDEDGRCPAKRGSCWVPADWRRLSGATGPMIQDLNEFVLHHARKYFAMVKEGLQAKAPGVLYLGPLVGGWGTPARREILRAAGEQVDVLQIVQIPPVCGNCTDAQDRIDFVAQHGGDKPWLQWDGYQAKADSYYAAAANQGQTDFLRTQDQRGALYKARLSQYFSARDTSTGTHHNVGIEWWEFYDNRGEKSNWGMVTRRDNPYDGAAARSTPGFDSWGYPTGCLPGPDCEKADYGNFLGAVTEANLRVFRDLVGECQLARAEASQRTRPAGTSSRKSAPIPPEPRPNLRAVR